MRFEFSIKHNIYYHLAGKFLMLGEKLYYKGGNCFVPRKIVSLHLEKENLNIYRQWHILKEDNLKREH